MPLRWPWSRKVEERQSAGGYSDAVLRLLDAEATGLAATPTSTAAAEAAAGLLARAFMSATVKAPAWAVDAITPIWLAQVARDVLLRGEHLSAIRASSGRVVLVPAAQWNFEGGTSDEASWMVRCTAYGPSSSETWLLPQSGVVFTTWGSNPGTRYVGSGPMRWASTTSNLYASTERTLGEETSGAQPAMLIPLPDDGGAQDGETGHDRLHHLRQDIRAAKGRPIFPETTASGYDMGRSGAPMRDFDPRRLGANPPAALVQLAADSFLRTLASTGTPADLVIGGDSQGQREALRRWHQNLVLPMAKLLSWELSRKLETDIELAFDGYALDLQGRAAALSKLTGAGMSLNEAQNIVGLLAE